LWHKKPSPQRQWHGVAFTALLAVPALFLAAGLATGQPWRWGIRPSGDISAKLLIAALTIAPLRALFPTSRPFKWLASQRRAIGLAAFLYALLHLSIFTAGIGRLDWIVQGMAFASMWTGWVAFALLAVVASISSEAARTRLGQWWKRLQRLSLPAAALVLAHWLLLTRSPVEALLHFAPLVALRATAWLPRR